MLMAVTMVAAFTGCGDSKKPAASDTEDTSNKEIEAADYYASVQKNAEIYKKYVTLGEYKGIEVKVDRSGLEVTDDDVESNINSMLNQFSTTEEIKEGVTAIGDDIILDYSGKKDGVAFSGGTATDASYTIGSGLFISDLDNGLAGLTIGQEYDIPCKFPDDYTSADLAGQDVVFTVKVTAKTKTVLPELTDAWVAEKNQDLGFESDVTTVEGLRKATREYLENYSNSSFSANKFGTALDTIIKNSTINGYPEAEVASLIDVYKNNVKSSYETYASYYESMGISSYEDYLKNAMNCSSEEEFDEVAKEAVHEYLEEKMVITIIAAENNLAVTADEINEMGEQWAADYGYNNYQEILDAYTKEMNAEVGFEVLSQKVQDFVNENAKEVTE